MPRKLTSEMINRKIIEKKYMPEPMSGCWLWMGALNAKGYGDFYVDGKSKRAHRVSYEFFRGKIPDGLVIDHLCRTRCCINPYHLEAVSNEVNASRNSNSLQIHCKRGHSLFGDNLYLYKKKRRSCKTCRKMSSLKSRKKYWQPPKRRNLFGCLSSEQIHSIRNDHRFLREIAADHNVSISFVWNIKNPTKLSSISSRQHADCNGHENIRNAT